MNIYNKGSIIEYYTKHPKSKKALASWYHDVLEKDWKKPNDVVKDFNTARTIKNDRVVFEINGNNFRLIVEIQYQK